MWVVAIRGNKEERRESRGGSMVKAHVGRTPGTRCAPDTETRQQGVRTDTHRNVSCPVLRTGDDTEILD